MTPPHPGGHRTMDYFDTPLDAVDPFKLGLKAAVAGDFSSARVHLWRVVATDPHHELAWQWLAKAAENRGEQEYCLARALALDPRNERSRLSLMLVQEEDEKGKPEPVGSCIFCDLPWATPPLRCARCRGFQDLSNPQVFLDPIDVDTGLLGKFTERQTSRLSLGREERRWLALAQLNLGDLFEAVSWLRDLAEDDPRDEEIRVSLLAISGRLAAIKIDSGFETEAVDRPSPEELGLA